jgi:hypothetical protein
LGIFFAPSGSIDFAFYSHYMDGTTDRGPGLIGRATLGFAAGSHGAIPGVSLSGQFLLEITTFSVDTTLQTFVTRFEYGSVTDPKNPLGTLLQTNTTGGLLHNPKPGCDGDFNPGEFITCNHTFGLDMSGHRFNIRLLLNGDLTIVNLVHRRAASSSSSTSRRSCCGSAPTRTSSSTRSGRSTRVPGSRSAPRSRGRVQHQHHGRCELREQRRPQPERQRQPAVQHDRCDEDAPDRHAGRSGFPLHIDAHVDFLQFVQADGSVDIAIESGAFTLAFNLTVHIGPIDVHADGFAGVYSDGIVLKLAVSFDASVLGIIHIGASGELRLNTTHSAKVANGVTIGARSFRLALVGDISVLEVIRFHATFMPSRRRAERTVGRTRRATFFLHSGQGFDFTADAPSASRRSPRRGGAPAFDLKSPGGVLGTENFGLIGEFTFVSSSARIGSNPFSPTYGAPVFHRPSFSASVKALRHHARGLSRAPSSVRRRSVDVVVTVKVKIDLLFVVMKTARFKIGTLQLPTPIFLAGDRHGRRSAKPRRRDGRRRASWHIGGRAGIRGVGVDDPNETFIDVSGTAGNETIKVTAMGRQQIFRCLEHSRLCRRRYRRSSCTRVCCRRSICRRPG